MKYLNLKNTTAFYVERTPLVVQYFKDIKKWPPLDEEEETALLHTIKTSKVQSEVDAAKQKLIMSNQLLVASIARKFNVVEKFLDLINIGTIALDTAIENFKEGLNAKFSTYATSYVYRDMSQYLRDCDPLVRKTNVSKTYHYVNQARSKFYQENEREPTNEELTEILNRDYNQNIKDPFDVQEITFMSIDQPVDSEDDETTLEDVNTYNDYTASSIEYESSETSEYNSFLTKSLLSVLSEREQTIIKKSFGIGELREYEPIEIAKEMGLTPERVRQIKTAAMAKLKDEFIKRSKSI